MHFLDTLSFWQKFWAVYFFMAVSVLVIMDIIAVVLGHRDRMGDKFTFTHWLIMHVGLSIIGAFAGYIIAHFLIVHRNG